MAQEDKSVHGETLRSLPTQQDPKATAPVVSAPQLPPMEGVGQVKTVLRDTLLPLMGAGGKPSPTGSGQMEPVPAQPPPPQSPSGKPQEPRPDHVIAGPQDGYIRMEVHFENGVLTVTGVKQVPGPLALASGVTRGYVYEALIDNQQVGLGSLPDVGVRRAFANRDVPGEQALHHFVDVPAFDFFVRLPMGHVSTANLLRLNLVLHRVEDAPDRLTSLAPLQTQPGVKTVEVARLAGIRLEQLPPNVRPEFERILTQAGGPQ